MQKSATNTSFSEEVKYSQVVIEPSHGWLSFQLRDLWLYRELLYLFIWRDIKVRYKQTILGIAWIVLQPLVSMVIFTVLFGILLQVPSGDVPYPLFAFAGLLPWTYFASSLNKASTSLVMNSTLITKIYFPRLIIPTSSVLSGLLDFGISFLVFIGLMAFYRVYPTAADG